MADIFCALMVFELRFWLRAISLTLMPEINRRRISNSLGHKVEKRSSMAVRVSITEVLAGSRLR